MKLDRLSKPGPPLDSDLEVPVLGPGEPRRRVTAGRPDVPGVMRPIPRQRMLDVDATKHVPPPMMKRLVFTATGLQVIVRLLAWSRAGLFIALGTLWDLLRRRDTPERRAARLRETIERMGGTFVKIGQQMAMRVDLLPMVYCDELSKMLDRVPPFPTAHAIARIEAAIGRPLLDVFAVFDPEPIGSASVSCVFHGILKGGEHVAVKVRRPEIGRVFAADLRAIEWLVALSDFLTLSRPGLMRHVHYELRSMLLEELDLRREARYTDLFRRRVRKKKYDFLTAPRVYFDLSNDEVLVTEFITGVPLGAVISAVEGSDDGARRRLAELDIDPRLVARRMVWASMFGIYENLLFHADPHPANVFVRPHGELVFIDFGSCGTYMERERRLLAQVQYAQSKEDVEGMVRASIALMEPLPPVDAAELERRAESAWWQALLATKARGVEWWERTSAGIWINFLQVTREYQIPLNLNTLRMVRATLLYDTLAARLDPGTDIYKIYRKFIRARDRRDRKRARRRLLREAARFRTDDIFLAIERARERGIDLVTKTENLLDSANYRFSALSSKATYAWHEFIGFVAQVVKVAMLVVVGVLLYDVLTHRPLDPVEELRRGVTHRGFIAACLGLSVLLARRLRFRLADPEQN